ncbi:MAG: gamma-glutamyltransferase [Planctomycetota bacterium]|nr:MAG: gamma-glutamyltransferase [Planctomycetota bacterium]
MLMNWDNQYTSTRKPVFAKNIVSTSQPLAAQAGLHMLIHGGNAVDAAIATAITLTIVEPTSNGLGSDAFAIIWDGKELSGINGSGRSPKAWTTEQFNGHTSIPRLGWNSISVPGAVDVWSSLSKRFGRLPFKELFQPAINYAKNGFLISKVLSENWPNPNGGYAEFPEIIKGFCPNGKSLLTGELFNYPDQAKTLERIAESNGQDFYIGEIAEKIIEDSKRHDALMTMDDLANHKSEWVDPISQDYEDIKLHEIPPNGQGLAALIALGILKHLDVKQYPIDSADFIHIQLEAMKLALADAFEYIGDPTSMNINETHLLKESHLKERACLIDMAKACHPKASIFDDHGTVYLTAADEDGMMVSFIQSNYQGFGSGIVIPGTGIAMNNRASGFSLTPGHPNQVDGGKRPFHTIIPGFITKDNQPLMSFGVMGGHMQAQGHVQTTVRMFSFNQNIQAACDAPRWFLSETFELGLEEGISQSVKEDLMKRGHKMLKGNAFFGRGQFILKLKDGYVAASDPRADGYPVGY